MPLQPPSPLKLYIKAGVPQSPCGLPLLSPWGNTVLWLQSRTETRDLGQAVCKASCGNTLSKPQWDKRGWGAIQTKAVMAHLAFLQDFPPQPSALERLLLQVCMASLCPPGPPVMSTVLVLWAHLVAPLFPVSWCVSPAVCPVLVPISVCCASVQVPLAIQTAVVFRVCRDLSKQERCSGERWEGQET